MTEDQSTQQDPTQQYHQPDQQPEQELEHPGIESGMRPEPDYGFETYRGYGRLEDKAAIITGGDSGIGRAVALAFAREGADVLISYLEEEEQDAQETARVVEEAGKKAVKMPGDMGDEAHCQSLVEEAVRQFGGIDVLVNNAAYQMYREGILSISAEELEHTYRTNVFSMFYLRKGALAHMREGSSIHKHLLHRGLPTLSPRLRVRKIRHSELHQGAGHGGRTAGHQGQRRGCGARVEPAHTRHHARRVRHRVRAVRVADGPPCTADRAHPRPHLPRLPRVEPR